MTIKISLNHTTSYNYSKSVNLGLQTVRLRPASHCKVNISSYSLEISPKEHFINWQQDPYSNYLANITIPKKVKNFTVKVDLKADIKIINPFDFFLERSYEKYPFTYNHNLQDELFPYLKIKDNGPLLQKFLSKISKKEALTTDFIISCNQAVNEYLQYIVRLEHGVYSCEEVLEKKIGSCRDMAWLLCQVFRHLGVASRFVSGYLVQLKADQKALDGPSGIEEDGADLHAWTEVYLPGAGWIGLDPTSGLLAGEGHIPLCSTPTPETAAPISGLVDICQMQMHHEIIIKRIDETPRVTKPFTEAQWAEIDALGAKLDKKLQKNKVDLTMGGEPTFVSIDDREDGQWNTQALGAEKREKAIDLLLRLKDKFSSGAALHFGQGKWYGGEALPRWSLGCYWRLDGEHIWQDKNLIADEKKNYGYDAKTAKNFISELAKSFGLPTDLALPACESANHKDLTGYVLPLLFGRRRRKWLSNYWQFLDKKITLVAGDSPLGYRIPMFEIPAVAGADQEALEIREKFYDLGSLPSKQEIDQEIAKKYQTSCAENSDLNYLKTDKFGYVRTALCVEARAGKLYIFLPPTSHIEHYLDLLARIEFVAKKLQIPVLIEGYAPPFDLRVKSFNITPDPGVIEVNVQYSSNWSELKEANEILYEQARQARLTAEKFLIDGRRVGTGGGNHIVIGGKTLKDSPFLRRPDLLKSIVTYFQNHPSLSYLFSGTYIGPTSQAPRIDEARYDSLFDLEISMSQIKDKKAVDPIILDRIFRNILIDITGNTHRSEICLDKLFPEFNHKMRLGLVEFRGFEMTPHHQMNLLQMLLIRALVMKFWQDPYSKKLIRFGNNLHDRFMLPHYLWQDFLEILDDLRLVGFDFKPEWFAAQFNFRFPTYGNIQFNDTNIELKMALEPWSVLGEDVLSGSTSRKVDSSVERLQIKLSGHLNDNFVVTCNGYKIPFKTTGEKGVKVAGVRFKAWDLPFSLHPHLPVNTPLVFDVVDIRNNVAVAGCTYYPSHPGGRNYQTFPVNVNEAEGRCLSRFAPIGHSHGKIEVKEPIINEDFVHSLDLRLMSTSKN